MIISFDEKTKVKKNKKNTLIKEDRRKEKSSEAI